MRVGSHSFELADDFLLPEDRQIYYQINGSCDHWRSAWRWRRRQKTSPGSSVDPDLTGMSCKCLPALDLILIDFLHASARAGNSATKWHINRGLYSLDHISLKFVSDSRSNS